MNNVAANFKQVEIEIRKFARKMSPRIRLGEKCRCLVENRL